MMKSSKLAALAASAILVAACQTTGDEGATTDSSGTTDAGTTTGSGGTSGGGSTTGTTGGSTGTGTGTGTGTRITGPLDLDEQRSLFLLAAVVTLWCTEPIHGLDPALVALMGALVVSSPRYGSVKLGAALKKVPWSMLLFMAATLALGSALVTSGAAHWLAQSILGPVAFLGAAKPYVFVVAVVLISTAAHLVIQSRSARSAVLIPIVIAAAGPMGVEPMAAAFASTAAAGFCHTLTSSAKPVAIFAETNGEPNYDPADLLRLSAWLAPVSAAVVILFSFTVWPLLGLPLFTPAQP